MSDIETLIQNRVRGALEQLNQEGIGYIDSDCSGGFRYCVDGRRFEINIGESNKSSAVKKWG